VTLNKNGSGMLVILDYESWVCTTASLAVQTWFGRQYL
jgi:hypothetical protein